MLSTLLLCYHYYFVFITIFRMFIVQENKELNLNDLFLIKLFILSIDCNNEKKLKMSLKFTLTGVTFFRTQL